MYCEFINSCICTVKNSLFSAGTEEAFVVILDSWVF